jgi:Fur family ferric uptake transcriptional regulator
MDTCTIRTMDIATTMERSNLSELDSKTVMQRNTRQKSAIRDVFVAMDRPLGPQEILEHAGSRIDGLGIATVYRNIKALVEEGWLTAVDLPGEPSRYEISGKAHHHHFHCVGCKKVFDLPGCPVEVKPNLPPGFIASAHELILYGKCDVCGKVA